MKLYLLVTVATLLFTAGLAAKTITATGRLTCRGEPIPFTKITLRDDDIIGNQKMATGSTDSNGFFTITGRGGDGGIGRGRRPDPFVRPEYEYSSIIYGRLSVGPTIPLFRKQDKTRTLKNKKGKVDFGTVDFNSDECKAYLKFKRAIEKYRTRVGMKIPVKKLKVLTRVILNGGTPYATTDKIRIPRNYNVRTSTADHELAHIVRHTYDGGLGHFLRDVVRYLYTRNHNCKKRTNNGFAFNEGWASFYSGGCERVITSATDFEIEGHVAVGLKDLMARCNSTWRNMVNVLIRNRRRIHSFEEYKAKHKALYACD